MGRFAFHILIVSFHPRPNAECKSSRLSPADVEKLNHGDRFQLKLPILPHQFSSFFFSWSCTVTFAKIAAGVQSLPTPRLLFSPTSSEEVGGKKPSGSVTASSVNVFVSYFWPTWCNSSRASVHKMLIRGWSETPSWTRTASDPLRVCKQGGNGFDCT